MQTTEEPFVQFKAMQRESWKGFAANEAGTTPPAAELVRFAKIAPGAAVLDVACGTGVVAVTAARAGGRVQGLDLTPELLTRARENAAIAKVEIVFTEGDVEALPYPDHSFDVVLSQFGHMFAPRPAVSIAEMLRVLKPGGRIAFSTWPPEHVMGKLFATIAQFAPPPEDGNLPASPPQWGDPSVVRARLGEAVTDLHFERGVVPMAALSPEHLLLGIEESFGPLTKLRDRLAATAPERLAALRAELLRLVSPNIVDNLVRQHYLMSRAVKSS